VSKGIGLFCFDMTADEHEPLPGWAFLRRDANGSVVVRVHLVPNASSTQIDGLHDGALKLRLHAPPVDGKANAALVRWLATALNVARTDVELLRGHTARRKELRVSARAATHARWTALQV
jgi:uncharacterized protein